MLFKQLPKLNSLVNKIEKKLLKYLINNVKFSTNNIVTRVYQWIWTTYRQGSQSYIEAGLINSGIKFIRTDLIEKPVIEASLDNIFLTKEELNSKNDVIVQTTEHLLAAILCLQIDNIIEIDSDELPILDGSSKIYTELLKKCGVKQQKAYKKILKSTKHINILIRKQKANIFWSHLMNLS